MKLIRIVEVFHAEASSTTAFSKKALVQDKRYSLREFYLNLDKIVTVREWVKPATGVVMPEDLDDRQRFSYLEIDAGMHTKSIIAVGNPEQIQKKSV